MSILHEGLGQQKSQRLDIHYPYNGIVKYFRINALESNTKNNSEKQPTDQLCP